jgi:hypothetical protein
MVADQIASSFTYRVEFVAGWTGRAVVREDDGGDGTEMCWPSGSDRGHAFSGASASTRAALEPSKRAAARTALQLDSAGSAEHEPKEVLVQPTRVRAVVRRERPVGEQAALDHVEPVRPVVRRDRRVVVARVGAADRVA